MVRSESLLIQKGTVCRRPLTTLTQTRVQKQTWSVRKDTWRGRNPIFNSPKPQFGWTVTRDQDGKGSLHWTHSKS